MWAANFISAEYGKMEGGKADPGVSSPRGQEEGGPGISGTASGKESMGRKGESFANTRIELRSLGRALHTDWTGVW